jgi:ABC-type nickel/cobalt efflux system permease component RcnA
MHFHEHGGAPHLHLHSHAQQAAHAHGHAQWDARRSLGLGLAHGMAGSGTVLVLVVAATPTAAMQLGYVGAFGVGTIAGMLSVSFGLGLVIRAASRRGEQWATAIHLGAAAASVIVGILLGVSVVGELG